MYTAVTLCAALDDILRLYNNAGIEITMIHCDNEFRYVFREVNENWEINFNYSSP